MSRCPVAAPAVLLTLIGLLGVPLPVAAQTVQIWPPPPDAPQPGSPPEIMPVPQPRPQPGARPGARPAPLEVRSHQVRVTIDGQLATTRIEQVFYNPSSARLEGTFLFPMPPDAPIDRFSMDVNSKDIEAELLDADKARQIYEDIVRRTRDPALLEYCGRELLRARIFPIEPHGEKRVTLEYTQLLESDAGLVRYRYPLHRRMTDGRAFVQNGSQWVDTRVQAHGDAPVQRVVVNSDAYFDLMRNHPEAAAWLAVARNLQVVIDGKVVEIVDES